MKKRHVVPFVIALLAISAFLAFSSSSRVANDAPAAVAVSVLSRGDQSAMEERKNYRITTPEELEYFWNVSHGADGPPVPIIDFEAHDVLVVFEGMQSSGGYDITVESVVDQGDYREVTIRHVEPGASCATTSVTTSPFEFVVVPGSERPLKRIDLTEIADCS